MEDKQPQGGEVVDLTALLQRNLQRKFGQEPTQLSMVAPAPEDIKPGDADYFGGSWAILQAMNRVGVCCCATRS